MLAEEGPDRLVVLLGQHRAGDVGDAPARLHQLGGPGQHLGLILDALGQRAGAHAPFCIGIAPPGAGAGAGRIDQDEIGLAGDVRQRLVAARARDADVDDGRPRARQPVMQRRETAAVEVGGVEVAAIGHQGSERKCLAPCPRTEVDHRLAGLRAGKQGDELRALVLDLEGAGEEAGLGLQRGAAPVMAGLEAQRIRRPGALLRLEVGKVLHDGLAARPEAVDAQIDRSPGGERLPLLDRHGAEGLLEGGPEPFRDIGPHPARCIVVREGGEKRRLVGGERRRRMVLAGAERGDLVEREAAQAHQHAEHQRARLLGSHGVAGGGLAAQRVIDQRCHRRAVLRAGEAARQPPVLERVGRGAAALDDILQHLDGGADPGGWRHGRRVLARTAQADAPRGKGLCFNQFDHDATAWAPSRHVLDAVVP